MLVKKIALGLQNLIFFFCHHRGVLSRITLKCNYNDTFDIQNKSIQMALPRIGHLYY